MVVRITPIPDVLPVISDYFFGCINRWRV
jgi:hypothetical protein